ncbi:MAG: thrombospondin type-1 domain-containing protein [Myxococcota bacterium]
MRLFSLVVLLGAQVAFAQSWSTSAWSACSATCGGGTQTRTVLCLSTSGGTLPDSSCPAPKPATMQTCNTQACPTYTWQTSAWSACSMTCGGGTMTRTLSCVDATGQVVSSTLCTGTPPATTQTCNTQACPTYTWQTSAWSACSMTCGGGTQTRSALCVDATGQVVSNTLCTGTPPMTMQSCNTQACPSGTWMAGAWGVCSVSCGGGTQSRTVVCVDSSGAVLPASACTATPPATTQTCNAQACPAGTWMSGAWGACSASCGGGTQSRTVTCVDASGAALPTTECTGTPPATMQTCNGQACPAGTWTTSAWGACSAACGGGVQSRTVSCVDASGAPLPASACSGAAPATMQTCNAQACVTGDWSLGAWSACDVACGGGVQTRIVACVDPSGATLPATMCPQPTPATMMTCNAQSCPAGTWVASEFGACSASCGGGVRERTVRCLDSAGAELPESACAGVKPATQETCQTGACATPAWQAGEWGACSASCGGGTQTRAVRCLDASGAEQPVTSCTGPAPATTQTCNPSACEPAPKPACSLSPGVLLVGLAVLLARRTRAHGP